MNEKETAHKGLSKINIRYSYLSACNKDVASNKVATLRSIQSRIASYVLLANNKKPISVDQPSLTF